MSELQLDITKALQFLDMLDPKGRHTIASEHPTNGKDGGPRWEGGATYEHEDRISLIADIKKRQARGSNVYYSVNRPCRITEQTGSGGKNNIDDIVAIRALAFDIDFIVAKTDALIDAMLKFIDKELGELRPSLVISTGGGFQLIYLLEVFANVNLYRKQPVTDEQKEKNKTIIAMRSKITTTAHNFEAFLRSKVPKDLPIKIDNMSNVDRVMRLPGTVNHPKLEKQAKGQRPALAHILKDYQSRIDIHSLINLIPAPQSQLERTREKKAFVPREDDPWTPYEKAKACIEFVRDEGLADTNEQYTIHVMLPLIGAIHDDNKANQLTLEEAEELFLEAVSGGNRYGQMGRGEGYFRRQWRSHRPELKRNGTKSIGGLVWFCTEHGFKLPWKGGVAWETEFLAQEKELSEKRELLSETDFRLLKKYFTSSLAASLYS
jgi:hypothetical protein